MLYITIIQTDLIWENPEENRKQFENKFSKVDSKTELIVLPEMFTTGFTMSAEKFAESMEGKTVFWLKKWAKVLNVVICGSLVIKEKNSFYNRFIWVEPSGNIQYYDKRHLFRMAKENDIYNAGNEQKVFELNGWKILPQVCYDLRFPVWSRNTKENYYDVIIYVANWPSVRVDAWFSLLKARAIENLSFCVGVNRIGLDGNNILYNGKSVVFDYKGVILSKTKENEDSVEIIGLSKKDLESFGKKFPAHLDADSFTIEN